MSNATGPLSTIVRDGEVVPLALSNVKVYRGAAAAVVAGTGYGLPLVTASYVSQIFVGIFEETYDNSAGSAGGYFTKVRRKGLALFGQTGTVITAASLGVQVYFADDHTVTLASASAISAGIVAAVDASGGVWVDMNYSTTGVAT